MSDKHHAELYGGPLETRTSLFSYVEKGLRKDPDCIASIVMHQSAEHLHELTRAADHANHEFSGKCLSWTYSQLHRAALRLAAALQTQGVRPEMRLATFITNRIEFHLLLWTCQILRLTLCSVDPGAVTEPRREEFVQLMATLQPEVVVVLDAQGIEAVSSLANDQVIKSPTVKIVLDEPKAPSAAWHTMFSLASAVTDLSKAEDSLLPAAREYDPDRIFCILFTSGTSTGKPKACPRTAGNMAHFLANPQWTYVEGGPHRRLASSANFRVIAPALALDTWKFGGTLVVPNPIAGPKGTVAAIREHQVNVIPSIPALILALIAEPEFQDLNVSCVRDVSLGGDVITRDIHLRVRRAFPHAQVVTRHGMTEGGGIVRWPFDDAPLDDIPFYNDISPLGTVMKGARIRIRDPQTGSTVRRNQSAELCVHGPAVIDHYLNHQHHEAFFTDPDTGIRWFRTGDLGMVDDDGLLYILGRIKDVIKRAGIPITPAALESCIQHFTRSTCCVLAWPHEILGQEPLAVVQNLHGKAAADVKEEVLSKFGKDYALGPVLELGKDLEGMASFPLNPTGKIMKNEVLKAVEKYFAVERQNGRL